MKLMGEQTTLFLVRHGETRQNARHITMGQLDSPLTPKGVQQARATGAELQNVSFDTVYASDLGRCVRTADIITDGREMTVHRLRALRERFFGELEGRPESIYQELYSQKNDAYRSLSTDEKWRYKGVPDMESDAELFIRVKRGVIKIARRHTSETTLIVMHSGSIRILLVGLGFFSLEEMPNGVIQNGQCIVLEWDGRFRLKTMDYTRCIAEKTE